MPPKKKTKKAKSSKSKKAKGEEDADLSLKEKLKKAEMRIETLERYLVLRSEQAQRARTGQEEMRERLNQLDEDFKKEQAERFHIASDMIRQYKAMQAELIKNINELESKKALLKDQLDITKIAYEQMIKEKDAIIAEKDRKIAEQKQKMEDMVVEFGDMLRETLEQMGNTISSSGKDEYRISKSLINDEKLREIVGNEMFESKFKQKFSNL